MYPGHFATGLALKAAEPRAPTVGLMVGVSLLDVGFGLLQMASIEGGTLTHLECTWSHSLVSSVLLSLLFAAVFLRRGRRVAAVMAVAVFSHFVLDVLSHNPDMDLWPHSAIELGLGPWLGGLGGWLETLITVAGCAVYLVAARRHQGFGGRPIVVCAVVALTWIAEVVVVHGATAVGGG